MKFPTKVLTLSLVCMYTTPAMLSSGFSKISKMSKQIKLMPALVTYSTQALAQQKLPPTPSSVTKETLTSEELSKILKNLAKNRDTNIGMTSKDINKLKEYKDLEEACEELNNLLDNGDIENFTEIPYETATKVDGAIENLLKLILPKGSPEKDMYSAEYWINKIIENPEDDYSGSVVSKILFDQGEYMDSMDRGLCDYCATKILYSLTPYLNGNKISNIAARSVFGQMMLKIATEEDLKKMALRMIFSSFFSGDMKAFDFLIEYGPRANLGNWCRFMGKSPKYPEYNIYFKDKKLIDLIKEFKNHYLYICNNY